MMRKKTLILTATILGSAALSLALVPPPSGQVLPDFDARATGKLPGEGMASQGFATTVPVAPAKVEAIGRLEAALGASVVARWNESTGLPKMIFRLEGPMTGPDWRDAALIARSFLQDYADLFGMDASAIDALRESRRMSIRNGALTVLHLEQEVGGIGVFHGEVRFAITTAGEIALVSTGAPVASTVGLSLIPGLDADSALVAAADAVGVTLTSPLARVNPVSEKVARYEQGPFLSAPLLEPILFPTMGGARLAYKAMIETPGYPAWYEVVVDASTGALLHRYNMTKYVATSGLVFQEHPVADGGVPVIRPFYDNTVLTDPRWPLGWAAADRTIGNVIDSKDDWAGDNEATIGQRGFDFTPGAPYVFDSAWTNTYETSGNPLPDRPFAITQLFYFGNVYHNWMYGFGFDESAANWQNDNYGRGGKDGDRVFGDAQDSWSVGQRNNANMSTPPDGLSPRAQFFLFTAAIGARRDSDVDGDIVIHEFTHGLSNRLIGGGSASCLFGFQGGSMGEGFSDYYALAYYDNPVLGEYGTGDVTNGIRSHPYNTYPTCHNFNVGEFCVANACAGLCQPPFCPDDCEVHDEGQLWAATLWEMTTLLRAADPVNGMDHSLQIVTDGMKLAPCGPTFLDLRDGILLADRYGDGGLHQCLIWEAFADRKMGVSATTSGVDDKAPVGATDRPCGAAGGVVLNLDNYGCTDSLIATVQDGNATGPLQVQLTATLSGDTLMVTVNGVAPTFTSAPVVVELGAATADARLQVQVGDTITARYADAAPAATVNTTAGIICDMNVDVDISFTGGCSPDGSAWPIPISQIIDAGEIVDVTLLVNNNEPRTLTNVQVSISSSNPMVVPLASAPVTIASIAPFTGAGVVATQIAASRFLAAGSVDLDVTITADGFTGTVTPIRVTVPVHSDYLIGSGTTGVEDFEATNGGYTSYAWPGSPGINQWQWGGGCGGASGSNAWHAGPPSCSGNAAEQDANIETPVINPLSATRVAWYPTELRFQSRMSLGGQDLGVIGLAEPGFLTGGSFTYVTVDATQNSATFQPISVPYTAADTLGAGFKNENGLVVWIDFFTTNGTALSQHWAVDDVEVRYQAADAVAQAGAPTCVESGYVGDFASCPGSYTVTAYNTARTGDVQHVGNGAFWQMGSAWNLFDREFVVASIAGERVGLLAQSNPDNGAHQGVMAVNGQTITNPGYHNFGMSTCANIPTPVGPAATVAQGQPIMLSWTPFAESGGAPLLVGYNVFRLDAETYPQVSSTIDDYVLRGTLVGNTVGSADINRYIDTAPAIVTGPMDEYSYAIQPIFRCDGVACTTLPATFGGSETAPGKANLSTDNLVFNGVSTVPGTVKVSEPLLANYLSYGAVRQGSTVSVTWMTSMELNTLGYRVYRGDSPDASTMVRLSGTIPARGPGYSYSFEDSNPPAGRVFYQIREVAASGAATRTDVFEAGSVPSTGGSAGGRGRRSVSSSDGNGNLSPGARSEGRRSRNR